MDGESRVVDPDDVHLFPSTIHCIKVHTILAAGVDMTATSLRVWVPAGSG